MMKLSFSNLQKRLQALLIKEQKSSKKKRIHVKLIPFLTHGILESKMQVDEGNTDAAPLKDRDEESIKKEAGENEESKALNDDKNKPIDRT
jgi:hypothetical protein